MKCIRRLLVCICLFGLASLAHADDTRPNVVFILTDDQGYGDLSAHGNPVLKTPNLDRLREQSARFSDFHVSPTCSPTRSALLTGRHEFRNGVTHTILERERLTLNATTLAQVLQKNGYRTGIFGKWHLGDEAAHQPGRRGFDEVFIHGAGGIGQSFPGSCGDAPGNTYFSPAILHNGTFEKTNGFCTDVFFRQATSWIESCARAPERRPFYAYIATNAPHAPYTARPEDAALYAGKVPSKDLAGFFGMIHNIDDNVGQLLKRLTALGLDDNTIVVFMNDNGSAAGASFYPAGMRGSKVTPYLGGTRACSFWRWKGRFLPVDHPELTAHIDVFPTILDIAGIGVPNDCRDQVEGLSLLPLLKGEKVTWPDRTLFTHVGRWPKGVEPSTWKDRGASVRTTPWHLVSTPTVVNGKATGTTWQLFDLTTDYAEATDVAAQHPDVVDQLKTRFDAWWNDVRPMMVNEDAIGPAENPYKTLYQAQFGR